MRIKTTLFFWSSAFLIALLSITVALFTISSSTATITQGDLELAFLRRIVKQSGVEDFLSLLNQATDRASQRHHHHHHHHRKPEVICDDAKWKSKIISSYNVSLILTVDLKGCANFSSVQKAVDAVPDSSLSRTLIIMDSGIYRSLTLILFSLLNALMNSSIATFPHQPIWEEKKWNSVSCTPNPPKANANRQSLYEISCIALLVF